MKRIPVLVFGTLCLLGLFVIRTEAFSLLGPFRPWMTATNGFGPSNPVYFFSDIGGPMDIGKGYRWNIPVVTYGFDQSFLDYFGTNGVSAIENAIQTLNDLPPASKVVLTNYTAQGGPQINYSAQAENLYDLKSMTLALLLEQMGLAQPTRFIYVVRQIDPTVMYPNSPFLISQFWGPGGAISNQIVLRNFDPETLGPTTYINDSLYSGYLYVFASSDQTLEYAIPLSVPTDPLANGLAAADILSALNAGTFWNGLTRDDVGGLRYLLSTNNIAYETLLPGTLGIGTNTDSYVNGAWRPGIDKITFVPQPFDDMVGQFLLMTNQFTDTYITNGILMHQPLQRVTTQPDFLFCAAGVKSGVLAVPFFERTGTTNWINNSALNGNPDDGGPGVIQPQIKIVFNKLGHDLVNVNDESATDRPIHWGTFDGSTNAPIAYPITQTGTDQFTIRMQLAKGSAPNEFQKYFDWSLTNSVGSVSLFQTSTNLTDWVTIFSVTNDGSDWVFQDINPASARRFYRVVPQ